jgi:hypothetical protein
MNFVATRGRAVRAVPTQYVLASTVRTVRRHILRTRRTFARSQPSRNQSNVA